MTALEHMEPPDWTAEPWREAAAAWIDEQLGPTRPRTGSLEPVHLRPWSTVLRVPTEAGVVWFKASAPETAFEAGLYEVLVGSVPAHVLHPLGVDADRGWLLLPDGGAPLGERFTEREMIEQLILALPVYGQLQLEVAPRVEALLSLGVPDMRPATLPQRFDEALAAARRVAPSEDQRAAEVLRRIEDLADAVTAWSEELADSPLGPSIDHNDLHPWNVLAPLDSPESPVRFYDWGDSAIAHPFAAMLVPLGFVSRGLGQAALERARDAYLDVFSDRGSLAELRATLELACRLAKIARTLTWERALSLARDRDEPVDESFAGAPYETLSSLLDDSYVGGA